MRNPNLPAIARVAPFACYILVLALETQGRSFFGDFDTRWLYPLKIALVVGVLAAFRGEYSELRKFRFSMADAALSLLIGAAVFLLWIGLDVSWAVLGDPGAGYDPRDVGQINWLLAGLRLAGAALVVPVMEELFWRSFVMRWLERSEFLDVAPSSVGGRAVLISSVVFGFEHHQWLAGIVAGLAYGWLYRRCGQLHYAIASHALTNGALGVWVLATGQWSYW
jgi:CAAX prenyl protease-like protein